MSSSVINPTPSIQLSSEHQDQKSKITLAQVGTLATCSGLLSLLLGILQKLGVISLGIMGSVALWSGVATLGIAALVLIGVLIHKYVQSRRAAPKEESSEASEATVCGSSTGTPEPMGDQIHSLSSSSSSSSDLFGSSSDNETDLDQRSASGSQPSASESIQESPGHADSSDRLNTDKIKSEAELHEEVTALLLKLKETASPHHSEILQNLSEDVKNDASSMLSLAEASSMSVFFASDTLRADPNFFLQLIDQTPADQISDIMQASQKIIRENPEVMFAAMQKSDQNGMQIIYNLAKEVASDALRAELYDYLVCAEAAHRFLPDMVLTGRIQWFQTEDALSLDEALQELGEVIRNNEDWVRRVLCYQPRVLDHLDDRFKKDEELIQLTKYATKSLIETMKQLFETNDVTPENRKKILDQFFEEGLPECFRDDPDCIQSVIYLHPENLLRASERLRKDLEWNIKLIETNRRFIKYVDATLLENTEFWQQAIPCGVSIERAPPEVKEDIELAKIAFQKNRSNFVYLPPELRSKPELALTAITLQASMMRYIPEELANDKEFIRSALQKNLGVLSYLPSEVLNDDEFMSEFTRAEANTYDEAESLSRIAKFWPNFAAQCPDLYIPLEAIEEGLRHNIYFDPCSFHRLEKSQDNQNYIKKNLLSIIDAILRYNKKIFPHDDADVYYTIKDFTEFLTGFLSPEEFASLRTGEAGAGNLFQILRQAKLTFADTASSYSSSIEAAERYLFHLSHQFEDVLDLVMDQELKIDKMKELMGMGRIIDLMRPIAFSDDLVQRLANYLGEPSLADELKSKTSGRAGRWGGDVRQTLNKRTGWGVL